MADDKTAICNIALLSLGGEMIGDIAEEKPTAHKLNAIFEQVVRELLADDWFFNRTRIELTMLATGPAFGTWEYKYEIPSDCLFIRGLGGEDYDKIKYPYVREGRYILTNETTAYFHYNQKLVDDSDVSDVSLMPLWFHRLISARLAHILAPNITENQKIRSKVEIEWDRAFLFAKEQNGNEAYFEGEQGNNDWRDGAYRELP